MLHSVQLFSGFSHFWRLRIRLLYKKRNKNYLLRTVFQNENVIIALILIESLTYTYVGGSLYNSNTGAIKYR